MVQKCERTFNLHTNEFSSNVALKYFYENEKFFGMIVNWKCKILGNVIYLNVILIF